MSQSFNKFLADNPGICTSVPKVAEAKTQVITTKARITTKIKSLERFSSVVDAEKQKFDQNIDCINCEITEYLKMKEGLY